MARKRLALLGWLLLVVAVFGVSRANMLRADEPHRVLLPLVIRSSGIPPARTMRVVTVVGDVQSRAPGAANWAQATPGQALAQGSVIRTIGDSRIRLDISDGSVVALGFSTTMTVTQLSPGSVNPVTVLELGDGRLVFRDVYVTKNSPEKTQVYFSDLKSKKNYWIYRLSL